MRCGVSTKSPVPARPDGPERLDVFGEWGQVEQFPIAVPF